MAFKLHYRDDGASAPIEYLPTAANAGFDLGKALTVDSATGLAIACGPTAKPVYISVGKEKDGVTPAMRVHPSMVLETAMPSGGTALKTGQDRKSVV